MDLCLTSTPIKHSARTGKAEDSPVPHLILSVAVSISFDYLYYLKKDQDLRSNSDARENILFTVFTSKSQNVR
jgi:hypothetical protein